VPDAECRIRFDRASTGVMIEREIGIHALADPATRLVAALVDID
jgi:hypothetical protein